jgi:hypothetical protein
MQPINAEVLQGIAKTTFYGALKDEEAKRIYPKICETINQPDLTVTYTSFGGVPEPRQLSGARAATGARQAKSLADYTLTATVVEWEDTVTIPRAVIETNPQEIPRITTQMANKASIYMDRYFVATALPSTTALGYDGVALYSGSHAETGSNQDNDDSDAITGVSATHPTGAEMELQLDSNLTALKGFTDDVGTPVNAGVERYSLIVPTEFEYHYKAVLGSNGLLPVQGGLDVSGGTGRYRGMFDVYGSPFVATQDRYYIFCNDVQVKAMACIKNKDWEFKTNIGTDSDLWNYEQTALFTAYARWIFVPWNWKVTMRQVFT